MTRKDEVGGKDWAELRARLESARGPRYWRSLEEVAETDAFQKLLEDEFPSQASEWNDPLGRRRFLKLMGASLALAGVSSCTRQPAETIVPFARTVEATVPGRPLYFATAASLGGFATGVLVESHMGRPTKIEGNPRHPASLGASDAITQASILGLYDPDRSQVTTQAGQISSWLSFVAVLRREIEAQRLSRGAGLRILTETVTSPTLADQLNGLLEDFPAARWHQYEPTARDSAFEGSQLAFGEVVNTVYHFDRAAVVVSLDGDFLGQGPAKLRYTRDFIEKRGSGAAGEAMNRLYVAEGAPSITGAMADHRLRLKVGQVEGFARSLARALGVAGQTPEHEAASGRWDSWIAPLVGDLQDHRGSAIIYPGDEQPPIVHALAQAMNRALGAEGRTVTWTEAVEARPENQFESLAELAREMEAGQVEVLLILGGNPVFDAPAELGFAEQLDKVGFRTHLSLYEDETSELCHWHVPQAHYLESWSDARAYDGTATIVQPLIAPLYGGKTAHELLAAAAGGAERSAHSLVREFWRSKTSTEDFELFWKNALHEGVVEGTSSAAKSPTLRERLDAPDGRAARAQLSTLAKPAGRRLEVVFRPDASVWDGRFANNGWLQETPNPITKLTWDNPALLSPATAERLGLANEDVVEMALDGRKLEAPVWVTPGHADDSLTLHLGYGRTRGGRVAEGAGFNAYAMRTSTGRWSAQGLEIRKTGKRYRLACTQDHHSMEGRHLVRAGTLAEFQQDPHFAQKLDHGGGHELSLYPGHEYEGYAWGMSIDLNRCIGCNACMVACQAENNVPVVGKQEVIRGREMHWIRVDRYWEGSLDDPKTYYEPVACMHCESAPCEVVCPVGATVHSAEGLNDMVYNRCIGTRYCSNNCPYKVRRFNFLHYSDYETPSLKLLRNPDVTVRTRGVMEKCTYCVQRINSARIEAEKEGRKIHDGEITTACQSACPAQAIVFGDINDPGSRVARSKADPRHYGLLTELNTRPRTSYLARLTNPNPQLEPGAVEHGEHAQRSSGGPVARFDPQPRKSAG